MSRDKVTERTCKKCGRTVLPFFHEGSPRHNKTLCGDWWAQDHLTYACDCGYWWYTQPWDVA